MHGAELMLARVVRTDPRDDKILALHEEIRQLREALVPTVFFPMRWKLTPTEVNILSFLLARSPAPRDTIAILDTVWRDARDVPGEKVIHVYINRLRRKLHEHGIVITSGTHIGYSLSTEMASRLRAICEAEARGEDTTPNHSVVIIAGAFQRPGDPIEHHGRITCPNQLRALVSTLHREGRKRWPQMVHEDEDAFLRSVIR